MDDALVLALARRLKESISFKTGPRVGRLLPQVFESEGCDHTLARSREWLSRQGRDVESDLRWLKQQGGACDCKVMTNVALPLENEAEY